MEKDGVHHGASLQHAEDNWISRGRPRADSGRGLGQVLVSQFEYAVSRVFKLGQRTRSIRRGSTVVELLEHLGMIQSTRFRVLCDPLS
jgi:hypothetical protein